VLMIQQASSGRRRDRRGPAGADGRDHRGTPPRFAGASASDGHRSDDSLLP
jgi:hypothetical protein